MRAAGNSNHPDAELRVLSGWGRTAPTAALVHRPRSVEEIASVLQDTGVRGVIARGLGRSYGDLAQNGGGIVLDLTRLSAVRLFDRESGRLVVEAGCSLADIIDLVLPAGWFPPVVPGTHHVTVGGAVACDVHGKNHHRDGSFGLHVLALTLLTPVGEIRELDPERTPDEFQATVGGLGLTGVILDVTLRLQRVESAEMHVVTERVSTLDGVLERLDASDHLHRYSVAWIDCAAGGRKFGRGVLLRGDHATRGEGSSKRGLTRRLTIPSGVSLASLIRNSTIAAFNELYFRRAREETGARQSIDAFFFPLDALGHWNRLYGKAGFLQYQFMVPFGSENALREVLGLVATAGRRPALAVLKRFGSSSGLLSFPQPGWTLALDFPLPAHGLGALLETADEIVANAGGRVYLAKDSRLRRDHLDVMYPELARWQEIRAGLDPAGRMQSDLARRLDITRAPRVAIR